MKNSKSPKRRVWDVIFFIDKPNHERYHGRQRVTASSEAEARKKVDELNNPTGEETLVVVSANALAN